MSRRLPQFLILQECKLRASSQHGTFHVRSILHPTSGLCHGLRATDRFGRRSSFTDAFRIAQFSRIWRSLKSASLTCYIGASAQTVESAVTIPLEQQINGAEGMKYVASTSGNDGTSQIFRHL